MLKLDLHVHSCFSDDAVGTPQELISALRSKGIQGMALTDHNTTKGWLTIQKEIPLDFLVIPGMEISTADGHLLALNVTEPVTRGLPIEETVERVIEAGGEPIVPHLFRLLSGIKPEKLRTIQNRISAIEVFNGCSTPNTNLKTAQIAQKYHLGGTGGSDSHDPFYAGYAYTVVDTTDLCLDTVLSQIRTKKTWGEGRTMPLSYRRDRMVLSIRQYVQKGFKRM
jgi:predicted metal-dependent phosphoesterase TrpH